MRILIVEDNPGMGLVMRQKVEMIREKFPDAEVILVTTFAACLSCINTLPSPDVTLLDLTLSDSGWTETLARVKDVEDKSSVVIVTGHPVEKVREYLQNPEIEVVFKTPDMLTGSAIIEAIARALLRRGRKESDRLAANIAKMRELIRDRETTEIHAATQ